MPINLSGRPFLRLLDFSTEEIEYLLKLSKKMCIRDRTGPSLEERWYQKASVPEFLRF